MAATNNNVLHLTSWLSRRGGGIPPVVWSLSRQAKRLGWEPTVAGLRDEFVDADCSACNLPYLTGKVIGPAAIGYSSELKALLRNKAPAHGVVHSHGLWMHPGVLARQHSIKTRSPLVISPHGMLEPWALNNSRRRKKIAGFLFERRNLQHASCLHALCLPEAANIRRYGLCNPIAIIPNGVDLDELHPLADYDELARELPSVRGKKRIVFLSRIHPKKGLVNLVRAWQRVTDGFKDWCVIIAGPQELGHEDELKALVRELGLESSILFIGPVYGVKKKQLLAAADVFILPSFSEGFSMAILEAAAVGIPVLLTRECNFPELAAAGGALEIAPTVAGVEEGFRQWLVKSDAQRKAIGRSALELVKRGYTWQAIARQMIRVYEWLLGNGPAPEFVKLGAV